MREELKICVVCGGISSEREVSLRSGAAVEQALKKFGYRDVRLFDLKQDNLEELLQLHPDVAFLALHGKGGEDGSIQGMLDLAGIPYTGPDIAASALCMNKLLTKKILKAVRIPTAKFLSFRADELERRADVEQEIVDELGEAVVVKAPSQGSSIGVVLTEKREEIQSAIDEVLKYDSTILVEQRLRGPEITLPVIGKTADPVLLPMIEIVTENEFYDYTAKYTQGMSRHIIPARIDADAVRRVQKIGIETYQALGCSGISRVDFIVDAVQGPMVMEVNTIPGMTAQSLVPDAARAAGISFEELCSRILLSALEEK